VLTRKLPLAERIPTEFIARSDAYDVLSIAESFWTEDLSQYVVELSEYIKKDPLPGGLEDFSSGMVRQFRIPQLDSGKMYAIPQRMGVDIMFYRKDLFEKYNIEVPQTLEEYYETAKALTLDTDNDGEIDIYGATYQGIQGQQAVLDWYDWASPLGTDILKPPYWDSAAFNTLEGIKALEMRKRFYQEGLVSPGVLSYSFDDVINVMAQGKAAMTIMYGPYWAKLEDPSASSVVGNIGYAPAPKKADVKDAYFTRGWGLFLNKMSGNKDASWKFIKYLTAPEQQLYMALNHGNPPSRFSVLESTEYKANVPAWKAESEALKSAKIQPNISMMWQVSDILARYFHAAIYGDLSSEKAMEKAEQEVNEILN